MVNMMGMNKRQMEKMMKQLGVKISELENVEEIVIRTRSQEIIIKEPSVTITEIQGQKIYQISGKEEEKRRIEEEDVRLVMEQTGASREEARSVLERTNGDLAEAILLLKKQNSK
ncbi:MAG: nascent polypeptide-associated complex protein [Candidatus Hadarchaeales archaeon]